MMKKYCLLLVLAFLPQAIFGGLADYNYYYINGVGNELGDAVRSHNALRALVLSDVPAGNVRYLYQQNLGTFRSMIDQARDQALLDVQRDTFKRFWACVVDPSPAVCNSTAPLAPDMYQMVINTLTALDETTYVQFPQLASMISTVRNDYANGRKTLLIGHSQGSFYANQVSNYLQTHFPDVAACTDLVIVGTPATYVARSSNAKPGRWETRDNDVIINNARSRWPWGASILPPTWFSDGPLPGSDITGHKFIDSYLNPSSVRTRIRADIIAQTATITNSTCKLDQPATSCGIPIVGGGSTGITEFVMEIGQDAQTLTANFEAYTIPDDLSITANGTRLASSGGFVSGFHSYSFAFNPQILGTTQLRARVTGNDNPDTAWTLCIDCNGSASSCNRSSLQRNISISMDYQGFQYTCVAGPVKIDDQDWGNLTTTSPIRGSITPTGIETHRFAAPNAACICTQTTGCVGATNPDPKIYFAYTDAQGQPRYFEVPLAQTFNFTIQ